MSYSDVKYKEEIIKLTMKLKFIYNDLIIFYKIVNKLVPVQLTFKFRYAPQKVLESHVEQPFMILMIDQLTHVA